MGDLLLQVVFLSQIAKEEQSFEFNDVVETITEKLIRRHPYVFSNKKQHSSAEQLNQWEEIKAQERIEKKQEGILDGIAQNLPALNRSQKIQKRASKVGFDWQDVGGIFEKIKEETGELEEAIDSKDKGSIEEEIGDLLMIITNLAQKLDVNSEQALRESNNKFVKRFNYMEQQLNEKKETFAETSFEELDALWDESKKLS